MDSADKTHFDLAPADVDDDQVGEVLAGRYRLLRHLGAGQMARVYVAEQLAMGRNVAVKILHDEVARDEVAIGRFRQEVKVVARLRSPHTIQCFDTGASERGAPFLAMELLVGETLRQRIDRVGRLAPHEVVAIAAQAAASLDEAHDAGVLHRDLKPENVYLCAHPTPLCPFVKVLDFGLAKLIEPGPFAPRLTGERQTVGTPAYMAPEMIVQERAVDHRADLYALGVICFELITGQRPFHGGLPMEMMLAHVRDPIPRASAVAPGVPRALDPIFDRLLAKAAADRPDCAAEVATLLAGALG